MLFLVATSLEAVVIQAVFRSDLVTVVMLICLAYPNLLATKRIVLSFNKLLDHALSAGSIFCGNCLKVCRAIIKDLYTKIESSEISQARKKVLLIGFSITLAMLTSISFSLLVGIPIYYMSIDSTRVLTWLWLDKYIGFLMGAVLGMSSAIFMLMSVHEQNISVDETSHTI